MHGLNYNKKLSYALYIVFMSLFFHACKNENNVQGPYIARVYDSYLPLSKVKDELPDNLNSKDSARYVQNYIDNWVRQSLLIHQAKVNLPADQLDVEDQIESYRNSLYIYAYEKELVNQKLDTNVSNAEIESYYKSHPNNFELRDNIVKVIYLKLKKNAPRLNQVKNWYRSSKPGDRKLLEEYCRQFAENYYLDEESWLLFDDLLKEIKIETYNKEDFLKNNRIIESSDNNYIYLVNILAFKTKAGVSPLSFEKENIRRILLNKRKLELIEQMRRDIFNKASDNKEIEFFNATEK